MGITSTDIMLFKSEDMSDSPNAGGRISMQVVQNNQVNNIFDALSRIDHVQGNVSIKKIYARINSATIPADIYSGAHLALNKIPDDPLVDSVLIPSAGYEEIRSGVINFLHDISNRRVFSACPLSEDAYVGNTWVTVTDRRKVVCPVAAAESPVTGDIREFPVYQKEYIKLMSSAYDYARWAIAPGEPPETVDTLFGRQIISGQDYNGAGIGALSVKYIPNSVITKARIFKLFTFDIQYASAASYIFPQTDDQGKTFYGLPLSGGLISELEKKILQDETFMFIYARIGGRWTEFTVQERKPGVSAAMIRSSNSAIGSIMYSDDGNGYVSIYFPTGTAVDAGTHIVVCYLSKYYESETEYTSTYTLETISVYNVQTQQYENRQQYVLNDPEISEPEVKRKFPHTMLAWFTEKTPIVDGSLTLVVGKDTPSTELVAESIITGDLVIDENTTILAGELTIPDGPAHDWIDFGYVEFITGVAIVKIKSGYRDRFPEGDLIALNCDFTHGQTVEPPFDSPNYKMFPVGGTMKVIQPGDPVIIFDASSPDNDEMGLVITIEDNPDGSSRLNLFSALETTHSAGSLISSAYVVDDSYSRVALHFTQASWDESTWSDVRVGANISAKYDFQNYPFQFSNRGTITGRWLFRIVSTAGPLKVNIYEERIGLVATNVDCRRIIGNPNDDFEDGKYKFINPATGDIAAPYMVIQPEGWGAGVVTGGMGGWKFGEVLRVNTLAAEIPFWLVRAVKPSPTEITDDSCWIHVRGDVAVVV